MSEVIYDKIKEIGQLVKIRKKIWLDYKDIAIDEAFIEKCAKTIFYEENTHLQKELLEKPWLLIECCFQVVDKESKTVPFFLNEVQQDFIKQFEKYGAGTEFNILKGRQQGFTTLITAIQLCYTLLHTNFTGFTLADCADNVKTIFNDKAKFFFNKLPKILKPKTKFNNKTELVFDNLNSSWRVAPATDQVGRSKTITFCHKSEIAFYTSIPKIQNAIDNACTNDAIKINESTANGFNEFKTLWDKGECVNLFYEWWRTSEYRSKNIAILKRKNLDPFIKERIKWLREVKKLELSQIAWYVEKYLKKVDGENGMKQEFPCTALEAFVSSGNCVFNQEDIYNRIDKLKNYKPKMQGHFEYSYTVDKFGIINGFKEYKFINDTKQPSIKIFKKPIEDRYYVIGADTAGEGSDYFVAQVIDNYTGEEVAIIRQRTDEDLFTKQLFCLGKYYNDALISVEVNFSSKPVNDLSMWGYPKQYMRERYDQISKKKEKRYGFRTDRGSKPYIINNLIQIARENIEHINDVTTLKEMLTFVKDEGSKFGAMQDYHDDTIMALAIAHEARTQQRYKKAEKSKPKKLTLLDKIKNGDVFRR